MKRCLLQRHSKPQAESKGAMLKSKHAWMVQEEAQYLARSLMAAVNSGADLVPCVRADCRGAAVGGGGARATAILPLWCME